MIYKIAIRSVTAIAFFVLLKADIARAQTQTFPNCPDQISKLGIEQRGKSLRRQLNEYYDEFAVNSNATDINVTKLVVCYIPIGAHFADAENILKAAGFTVYPGPWSHYAPNGSSVRADIDHFRNLIIVDPDLIVFLTPSTPGHYDYVYNLSADFLFSSL